MKKDDAIKLKQGVYKWKMTINMRIQLIAHDYSSTYIKFFFLI